MEALLYCACGLDVHKEVIEACILRGLGVEPEVIRHSFGTTKPELQKLMDWLGENDCYTVAMESTGVYWKPIYQTLESESEYIERIWVVTARHMRKAWIIGEEFCSFHANSGSEGVRPSAPYLRTGTVSLRQSPGEILTGSRF